MKVNDLLARKNPTIHNTTPDTPLREAIEKLNQHNIGALLVMSGEKLAGIITERDVLHAAAEQCSKLDTLRVQDVMTSHLITCGRNETIDNVMELMTTNRIRHLPIMEKDDLVGIISIGDVVKAQLQKSKAEAEDLKEYIHGRR